MSSGFMMPHLKLIVLRHVTLPAATAGLTFSGGGGGGGGSLTGCNVKQTQQWVQG
jgi:hypothetical protein